MRPISPTWDKRTGRYTVADFEVLYVNPSLSWVLPVLKSQIHPRKSLFNWLWLIPVYSQMENHVDRLYWIILAALDVTNGQQLSYFQISFDKKQHMVALICFFPIYTRFLST